MMASERGTGAAAALPGGGPALAGSRCRLMRRVPPAPRRSPSREAHLRARKPPTRPRESRRWPWRGAPFWLPGALLLLLLGWPALGRGGPGAGAGEPHATAAEGTRRRGLLQDTTPPSVTAAAITSSYAPGETAYKPGDTVNVRLTFSEPVILTDVEAGGIDEARVLLSVGTARREWTRAAVLATPASATATLDFSYTIQDGDNDPDGLAIQGTVVLSGTAALRDAAGNDAVLTGPSTFDDASAKVVTGFAVMPPATIGEEPRVLKAGSSPPARAQPA